MKCLYFSLFFSDDLPSQKPQKSGENMTKCHALRRGHGRDEELDLHANAALEACEATVQEYCDSAPLR